MTAIRVIFKGHSLPHVVHRIDDFIPMDLSHWSLESASERGFARLLDRVLKAQRQVFTLRCRTKRLHAAIAAGYDLPVLQWWLQVYKPAQTNANLPMNMVCSLIINTASLPVVQWLLDQVQGKLSLVVMRCSKPEVARWLYEHGRHELPIKFILTICVKADATPEFIQWCMAVEDDPECSFKIDWSDMNPIKHGRVDILPRMNEFQIRPDALEVALRHGHFHVAKWLHQRFPAHKLWDIRREASDWKHLDLETVRWVLFDYAWTNINVRAACLKTMTINAASLGALDVLEYLYELQQSRLSGSEAAALGSDCLEAAAANDRLPIIQWLHDQQLKCTPKVTDQAARNGHLALVQWLHLNLPGGCTTDAMDDAAENGHLEIVQWLHANRMEGCTTRAMDNAATKGHLNVIQWLHEHRTEGCTPKAMEQAALHGHLDVMCFLHTNLRGVCTVKALDNALSNGHLHVFKWIHENSSVRCGQATFSSWARFDRTPYSSEYLDILEYAVLYLDYIPLALVLDKLIEYDRYGAVERILRQLRLEGRASIESAFIVSSNCPQIAPEEH